MHVTRYYLAVSLSVTIWSSAAHTGENGIKRLALDFAQRLVVVVVVVVVVQYNNKHGTLAYCRSVRHLAEATENVTKFYDWQLGVATL